MDLLGKDETLLAAVIGHEVAHAVRHYACTRLDTAKAAPLSLSNPSNKAVARAVSTITKQLRHNTCTLLESDGSFTAHLVVFIHPDECVAGAVSTNVSQELSMLTPTCLQVARHSSEKLTTQLIVTLVLNVGLAIAQQYLSRRNGGRQQRGCAHASAFI